MDFFGLDIGSQKIKIVQLRKRDNQFQLLSFGYASSPVRGLLSESESDLNSLAEVVKKLYQETRIATKNVVVALPQDQVFTRVITLPKLSEEELESALKWEAEQYVPFPLEEVTLAHQIIGQTTTDSQEKTEVILVAAPNHLIGKLTRVLKIASLNPISLEIEIFAIARSLVPPDSQTILLADLGATATDLAIVENGQVVFVNSVPTAGEALTRAVAKELGLQAGQAEAYKKAYGVDAQQLEGKIKAAIGPVLEVIVKEMEKTIQYYQASRPGKMVNGIILSGGTASLPEVCTLFANKLNLEIQLGNPFSRIIKDKMVAQIPAADIFLYTVAIGLAMKGVD